tara:strand:- start:587 stop:1087 length:501 start_codon:yes stop_codon:yes gene_type:complete
MKKIILKEELINAINESKSKAETCRKLNMKPVGNNYRKIDKLIKNFELDISHFTGQGWNVGDRYRPINKKKNIDDILQNKIMFTNSHHLKMRLIKENYKQYKCEICGIDKWLGKQIALELHHVDGDRYNNSLSNLKILCPNCHSQTDNHGSKNLDSYKHKNIREEI